MEQHFLARYKALNEAQRQAVDCIEGPVMVVAGPGSGKTELLSLRVANILKQTDVLPQSILCLTFTDSASVNMKKRLAGLIGNSAYHVAIHTFHSFGTEILGNFREYFYEGADMEPADDITKRELLRELFENLPFSNPLHKRHPEQGFIYLKDVVDAISNLKRGGLTPHAFKSILESNRTFIEQVEPLLFSFFEPRVSKKMLEEVPHLVSQIAEMPEQEIQEHSYFSLKTILLDSFRGILASGDQKLLTAWKQKNLIKDKEGSGKVWKESGLLEKTFAEAEIYDRYLEVMYRKGYFDFDDMLLETVRILEAYPEVRATLQERYLYIMVDEFQDTNGVQMKLLDLLTGVYDGIDHANILAVGDDDQAIFKFQGANLQNILGFHKKFKAPTFITLTQNYRSTQDVLDFARNIILQGEERLENHMIELQKHLIASNPKILQGEILDETFQTMLHEHLWIAEHIKGAIDKGIPPHEIAIIARKHAQLRDITKILELYAIPVAYEMKQNILEEPHIQVLLLMLEYVTSISRYDQETKDYLLPKILSYPFWDIHEVTLWKLSLEAYRAKKTWLEVMLESKDEKISSIGRFFIQLGKESQVATAEQILDLLMGAESEKRDKDNEPLEEVEDNSNVRSDFISPYKVYYFSEHMQESDPEKYVKFLSHLQVLIQKVRNYEKHKNYISADDVVKFIGLHYEYGMQIIDNNPLHRSQSAVQLLTAHKAKGLEFESVYVIHVQEDGWMTDGLNSKITFPSNLPLAAEKDATDDKLRLFFVALTRAKRNLYLTHHQYIQSGKETIPLRFLTTEKVLSEKKKYISREVYDQLKNEALEKAPSFRKDLLEKWFQVENTTQFSQDQKTLLSGLVEDYQMSVTHLNNFLDLERAGPHVFMEQNLLQFPQSKHPSGSYGTAMHAAIQLFYKEYKKSKQLPSKDQLLFFFEESLKKERLNSKDIAKFLEKGKEKLAIYFDRRKDTFDPAHVIEKDFRNLGVKIKNAHITGKIDRIIIDESNKHIQVSDFKTGKSFYSWKVSGDQATKMWKYRQQLLFYKFLIEKSSLYGYGYKAQSGTLEFLECNKKEEVHTLLLEYDQCQDELSQLEKLIEIVYTKICNLDFPNVEKYSKDFKGTKQFIEDLLEGIV